jgi:hypothetical protein
MTLPTYVVPGSLQTPSTASTVQIYATIRKVLLDYTSPSGDLLVNLIGQRAYVRAAPADPLFPYLTLRLDRTSLTAYNGYRETAILEVQCIGKPESQLPLVESAMDIVDQCLTAYTDARSGIMVGRSRTRQTVPMMTDPADSSVAAVIANYELFLWPRVLTERAD